MDLASMKRLDLQALCKRHGLPGGGTNADLVARLSAALTGSGGAGAQAVEVLTGKGCLKRPAGGSSSGGSGAGKKVTFVFEGEDDPVVEVEGRTKGRRGNPQVTRSTVVAKTKRIQKAVRTSGVERRRTRAQAAGDSADESDAGEAGTGAPVRRSSRNVVNLNAGNEVEMVAGVATQNYAANAVELEEKVGEAVDRERKRKTREHDEGADVSGQVGVSRRSTRSSGLVSGLAPVSSPAGEKKRGRRKAGDVTEQTCVQEQTSEVQHLGRTLRSGLAVVGLVPPIVSESKRSRRKLQEEEPAAKVAKLEISGRSTRSTSVAASVTPPIVVEKNRRKKEDLHSDGEPPTVPKLPITTAPVTRVLRSRAVQVSNSTVEETHFDKQLQSKRQPSGPSTRNRRNQQVASSVEEGSQEQVAPPCVPPPLRRSGRNHSEGDKLLNNNTTSESSKQSRPPMEGNDLNRVRLSSPNATKDIKEDGVAKADGALECKKRNPRNSRTKVARNGGEIQISDSSGKAKAIETEAVVAEPVRKSRRDSVVPTLLEQGDKGKRGNNRGQESRNFKDTDVENQPTVKEPVRRSTRKSVVPAMLEKERKGLTKEVIPEAHVRRTTQKSAIQDILPGMNPDAHVAVRRSMQKSDLPGMLSDENNDYGKKRIAEIGGMEKQLGVEQPARRLTRKSVVPAVLEKGKKGLHIEMKSETPVKRSVRNPVAPNMVDKGNNDYSEIVTMEESGVQTRNSQTRLQFAMQNDAGQQQTTHKSSKLVMSQPQPKSAVSKGRPAKRARTTVLRMPLEEPNADGMVGKEATHDSEKVTHEIVHIQEIRQVSPTVEYFPSAPLLGTSLEDTNRVQDVNEDIHQQDSGFGKSSHEEEQVASGQLVFPEPVKCSEKTNSDEVSCEDEENKESANYINSSCDQSDDRGPGEHAYCITDASLGSSLIAPANNNDELHHGSDLSRLEVTDSLDEPIGCSNGEPLQQVLQEQCEVLHVPVEEPNGDATVTRELILDGDVVTQEEGLNEQGEVLHMPVEEPNADGTVIKEAMQDGDKVTNELGFKEQCEVLRVPVEEPNADAAVIGEAIQDGDEVIHELSLKEQSEVMHLPIKEPNADVTVGDDVTPVYIEVSSNCTLEIRQEEEPTSAPFLGTLLENPQKIQIMNEEIHESEPGLTKSTHEEDQVASDQLVFLEAANYIERTNSEEVVCKDEENKKPININSSCELTDANRPDKSFTMASGISEAVPIEGSKSAKALTSDVETSAFPDQQPNAELEDNEFKENSFSCGEDSVDIVRTGSVNNEITDLAEGCLVDSCQEQEKILNDLSVRKSPEKIAICQVEYAVRSAICQTIEGRFTDEDSTKDHKEEHSGYNEDQVTTGILANSMSEPSLVGGSESVMLPTAETSPLPDEKFNTILEVNKEHSPICDKDNNSISDTGPAGNNSLSTSKDDSCHDMTPPKSPEETANGLLSTSETSPLPDEKSNIMLEVNKEDRPTCHGGNDYISDAGSVGNNNLCTLKDNSCHDMPAPKSPEDSVIRLDDSILASEGICQTSGRRRVDEISTQLLSFKISSAVKGSYIAMDTPCFSKQEDNLSQSAIAFLGNTRDTPAAKTNPSKLNTDHSVAKDSPTQVLPGNVELAVNNPDNILAVEQVYQDDVEVQEGILENTSSGSATPECKQQSGLLEEAVLHSTGNDKCPSSVEQTPFGLQSLFSQENIKEPMGHGASDVGLAAENPGNKQAMKLLQQDDVHLQEGTLEKTAVVSAKPEEIEELHSMKNEGCSSRVEQSPFGLQSLFLHEIMEEPVEYEAPGLPKFEGEDRAQEEGRIEKTPSPEPISDHATQVDLGVVSTDGDCVYTCQQDNEKEGLTEPSHEQEQVAFGQVELPEAVNHMKKDANSEEVPAIGDNQFPPGDSLYQLDSFDLMDEHINYLKEESDEDKED